MTATIDFAEAKTKNEVTPEISESVDNTYQRDDLKHIYGIGPAIEKKLLEWKIYRFSDLIDIDLPDLVSKLQAAGPPYDKVDPMTWPIQASLAKDGDTHRLVLYKAQATTWDVAGANIEELTAKSVMNDVASLLNATSQTVSTSDQDQPSVVPNASSTVEFDFDQYLNADAK